MLRIKIGNSNANVLHFYNWNFAVPNHEIIAYLLSILLL